MTWDQNDTTLKLWDTDTAQLIKQPIFHPKPSIIIENQRKSMILSHDKKAEATLWDTNLRKIIDNFTLPGVIKNFSPDGEYLAIEEKDGIRIHNFHEFTPEGIHDQACNIANHNLNRQEWHNYIGQFLPHNWFIFQPAYQRACDDFPDPPDINITLSNEQSLWQQTKNMLPQIIQKLRTLIQGAYGGKV